jgi:hypothetical protein
MALKEEYMDIKDGIGWDGVLSFGIVDESLINQIGLENFLKCVKDGKLKWKRECKQHNKVTNYSRNYIAQMLTTPVYTPWVLPSAIELGTGTGTPAATDTNLFVPVIPTLQPCGTTQVYISYYAQYISVWQTTAPITGTWLEAGLFDINNNLWAHACFNLTVNSGEMLIGQWQVNIQGN